MSQKITCPACGLASLELWGITECDDDDSLSLFCDEYYCPVCHEKFTGGIADYTDEYDDTDNDDDHDSQPADFSSGWEP